MDNLNILQMPGMRLSAVNPNAIPTNQITNTSRQFPSWIKHKCPVALFLNNIERLKRGTLQHHPDSNWYFHAGRTDATPPILMKNFHQEAISLITQQ